MALQKNPPKNACTGNLHPPMRKARLPITVTVRSMTDEEDRQFEAALHLLLTEIVAQHLKAAGGK